LDIDKKRKLHIAFGYPHNNDFIGPWINSVIGLCLYEGSKPKEMRILGSMLPAGGCYVDSNRSEIALQLLTKTKDDWVLMVDTDIEFPPNIMELLAAHIIRNPKALVIAGRANLLNGLPVFYKITHEGHIHQPFAFEGLKAFDLVGTGIIAINRKVFVELGKAEGHTHFFSKIISTEKILVGDDFSFCLRSKSAKIKTYGAWDIKGIHWKPQPCPQAYPELNQLKRQ
jgi:hypothetical protein